jgi:iron-sulfur cluster repair protein YtfE (RIC family)
VLEFLRHHLIPHAEAEDRALYPVVGTVMGAPDATATMSRDHVEVGRLTDELASLRSELSGPTLGEAQAKALRRVLYGLYALVKLHFAKEEEVYLPLLDARLSPDAARSMSRRWNKRPSRRRAVTGRTLGRLEQAPRRDSERTRLE